MPVMVFILALLIAPLPKLVAGTTTGFDYLLHITLPILFSCLAVAVVRALIKNISRSSSASGELIFRLPIIGSIFKQISQTEYIERLSLFELAGHPLIEATQDTYASLPGYLITSRYGFVRSDLNKGVCLADSLRDHKIIDARNYAVLSSAEQAGRLGELLEKIAQDERVSCDENIDFMLAWVPRIVYALVVVFISCGFF